MKTYTMLILLSILSGLLVSCDGIGAKPHQSGVLIAIDGTVTHANIEVSGCVEEVKNTESLPFIIKTNVVQGSRCFVTASNSTESGTLTVSVYDYMYTDKAIGFPPHGSASISYRPGDK